jgi:hypothetical protein
MEKRKQRDEKRKPDGDTAGSNIQTQNRVYGGPPTAPRWRRLAIYYAPSATPIYPSTTYCENAKKLRTKAKNEH